VLGGTTHAEDTSADRADYPRQVRLAMLGLGLIGGSVARAASAAGWPVRAWTPSGSGPRRAAADGIEPARDLPDAIRHAELVVLAAPPLDCLDLLDRLAGDARDALGEAVVTDVASTKVAIVERAGARHLRFVGGHPLAGRESSGYDAADPGLFENRPWVIIPPEPADGEAEARVEQLARVCRANARRLTAHEHDRAVAGISHLPLLLSAALAETVSSSPDWELASELAAGGWMSMTRLARGDAAMGAGIVATNRDEVYERLALLRATLESWATDLAAPDVAERTERRLTRTRSRLEKERP
jgi:prephenate dehydrogenase